MEDIKAIKAKYINLLDESVKNKYKEEQVQKFLEEYPILLPLLRPYENIIFRKMNIGEMKCDFAFARENSLGFKWHFIELEKPSSIQYTQDGNPHNELTRGIQQVNNWKIWFRENRAYVKENFPFGDKMHELGLDEPHFTLIFGRRTGITKMNRAKIRELNNVPNFELMSFDRLAENDAFFVYPEEYGNELKTCSIRGGETIVLSTFSLEDL